MHQQAFLLFHLPHPQSHKYFLYRLYKESDVNKKTADLRRRVEIMNSSNPDIIISVHQNSFTQESSKGAQVFYQTSSDDGKRLAEIMQMQLVEDLDKNNHRVAKPNSEDRKSVV